MRREISHEVSRRDVHSLPRQIKENIEMFALPGKRAFSAEKFEQRAALLSRQYNIAREHEEERKRNISEINNLLKIHPKNNDWIERVLIMCDKAPREAFPIFIENIKLFSGEIREKLARNALQQAPHEAAPELMRQINLFSQELREEFARTALAQAPHEAAPELMDHFQYFPDETVREEFARSALQKAPHEAASVLIFIIEKFPQRIQEEFMYTLLNTAPHDAVQILQEKFAIFSQEIREKFVRVALKRAPRQTCLAFLWYPLSPDLREEIKRIEQILPETEKEIVIQSEITNPALYKEAEDLEKQFSREEFPKTGSRTILLGGSLLGKVILRIIPNHAFIAWMQAYFAGEVWKREGFHYVPIEPILKVGAQEDDRDVRVYAGVLGISVGEYLDMLFTQKYHKFVEQQMERIQNILINMNIAHGHDHPGNFCVLHERTQEGEIDWDVPPRVYCIDFDKAYFVRI